MTIPITDVHAYSEGLLKGVQRNMMHVVVFTGGNVMKKRITKPDGVMVYVVNAIRVSVTIALVAKENVLAVLRNPHIP